MSNYPHTQSLSTETSAINSEPDETLSTETSLTNSGPDETLELTSTIVNAALDRKGDNIVVIKVSEVSYLADYFVIITGYSHVQVRAISQAIAEKVEQERQVYPLGVEGQSESSWILMDYADVIVHILKPEERDFYNLEAFWGHAERIDTLSLID
ncbi:MAG: ribosome silencing factor [Trichodesmium sp. MO_231.B1]|nr:ribosome silencing factor [Trichodesmium sp. MO_231.B1]